MAACLVPKCEKPAKNGGMCWGHYCSKRRYGDPTFASLEVRQRRRFFDNIDTSAPDGCWNWTGLVFQSKLPYGRVYFDGRQLLAHRVAWLIHHGELPDDRLVLHHCDNPRCVNPDHLYLGDHANNAQDRVVRNRSNPRRGEDVKTSKLTEEAVLAIRASTTSCKDTGQKFGVSPSLISLVRRGEIWAHVKEN